MFFPERYNASGTKPCFDPMCEISIRWPLDEGTFKTQSELLSTYPFLPRHANRTMFHREQ